MTQSMCIKYADVDLVYATTTTTTTTITLPVVIKVGDSEPIINRLCNWYRCKPVGMGIGMGSGILVGTCMCYL